MSIFLILAFLFFIGSVLGWCLELFYRKFFSGNNPEHKWINPGFLVGPYVPLYGFGLCALYLLSDAKLDFIGNRSLRTAALLLLMLLAMTAIEYIAGMLSEKIMHVKLWDYSRQWGNIGGIICPLFSVFWGLLGAGYYFFVHPHILKALMWLSNNLAFSFFIGFFFGVMTIDLCYSTRIIVKIRRFATETGIIVKYEELKEDIRKRRAEAKEKSRFVFAFKSAGDFAEHLKRYAEIRIALSEKNRKN